MGISSCRGSVLLVVPAALAVLAVGLVLVLSGTEAATDRARAQTAADAAALAGAAADRGEAVAMATANGALLTTFVRSGDHVRVVVQLGEALASARAERQIRWVPSGVEPG